MTGIGVVGDGISGLHLALALQQLGVPATLYGHKSPEDVRHARALNFVARSGPTTRREAMLGVDFWTAPETKAEARTLIVHDSKPLTFRADPRPPQSVVDFRIYLPALAEEYVRRGGRHIVGDLTPETVTEAARRHELVVVADSRTAAQLFERDPERSPFRSPQRLVCGGLYRGIAAAVPHGIELNLLPGIGEIFRLPFYGPDGRVDMLGLESLPGGPLEAVCRLDHAADPPAFHSSLLAVLQRYVPELRERIDEREFTLTRPIDLLQGGVVPVVRQAWRALPDSRFAIALGDGWIVNDPITGQGANMGSRCALALADAIAEGGPYDASFCRAVERQLRPYADAVVQWTNSFLRPASPQLRKLFQTAADHPEVAKAFAANLDDPVAMWRSIATPEQTDAFLSGLLSTGTCSRVSQPSMATAVAPTR